MHAHVSIAIFFSGSVICGEKNSWPEKCSGQSRYSSYASALVDYASIIIGVFEHPELCWPMIISKKKLLS